VSVADRQQDGGCVRSGPVTGKLVLLSCLQLIMELVSARKAFVIFFFFFFTFIYLFLLCVTPYFIPLFPLFSGANPAVASN